VQRRRSSPLGKILPGFLPAQSRRSDERLSADCLALRELRQLLRASGRFSLVDITPIASEAQASNLQALRWLRYPVGSTHRVNGTFALVFFLGHEPIANVPTGSFIDLFFFSIETLATVGYGDMHPQTHFGHAVATVEIFTGMSLLAGMTGLIFARFSRPRARFVFGQARWQPRAHAPQDACNEPDGCPSPASAGLFGPGRRKPFRQSGQRENT
jgi:Ion channel